MRKLSVLLLLCGLGGCPTDVCGDGEKTAIDQAEECDDGNVLDADGCQSDCTLSTGQDFVLSPSSSSFGHSYQDLSVAWTQWALLQPRNNNPTTDPDGSFAALGQPDDVWFLAGTENGSVVRTVTIPQGTLGGRPIFFPIFISFFVTFVGLEPSFNLCEDGATECALSSAAADCAGVGAGACLPSQDRIQAARDTVAMDGSEILTLEIDDEPVAADAAGTVDSLLDFRVVSEGVFSVEMPDFNIFDGPDEATQNFCQNAACEAGGTSAGTYPDCVNDGYFIYLSPLTPGEHTLRFTVVKGAFSIDVTYNLTIE